MKALLSIATALLFSALASSSTSDSCRLCDKTGVVPCSEHTADEHAYEADVLFCSTAAQCERCKGSLIEICKRCPDGPDIHKIAERQAEVAAWLAEQPMPGYLDRPVPAVETERFQLIIDTGTMKEGRKKIDGHTIMHRVARDVNEVTRLIGEHFQLEGSTTFNPETKSKREYHGKMRMWIWKEPADHAKIMREFLNHTSTGDYKLLGRAPIFSVWTDHNFNTVQGVRSLFTHNASHMLLSNLYRELWTGDIGGGWFDAGSGHWYEYEVHKRSLNYCIEEATAELDFHGGEWRAPIRKWLQLEEKHLLSPLIPKNTGAMTLPEQALCWSFYDWLVANHVEALPQLQQGLKKQTPTRDLLKEVLGMSLLQAEDAWREWVAITYPVRGDKPREPKK